MKRSIPVSVILSIVTCGIYGIYWMIMLNNELNRLSNHPKDMGGRLGLFAEHRHLRTICLVLVL